MKTWRAWCLSIAVAIAPGCASPAGASPAQIIFLRHAEKPEAGAELNERGEERAKALVKLFTQDPRGREHGPAVAIFAMRPHGKNGSVRAIQTMEPTARALGLTSNTHLTRDEFAPLVHAVMNAAGYEGKTVIICWEHDAMPDILKAFGWRNGPKEWPGKAYDRLWILDFENGKPIRFRDLPQKLLPGDKAK